MKAISNGVKYIVLHSILFHMLMMVKPIQCFQPRSIRRIRQSTVHYYTNNSTMDDVPTSFQQRMLDRLKQNDKPSTATKRRPDRTVQEVTTLKEYKAAVVDGNENKVVVARFYAPWCRACRAMEPGFIAMAKRNPNIKFIEVPVTDSNLNLHQGLGVPSTPYVHLYHPEGGLVEEQRLTRRELGIFHRKMQDYVEGSCSLELRGDWSCDDPYHQQRKAVQTQQN